MDRFHHLLSKRQSLKKEFGMHHFCHLLSNRQSLKELRIVLCKIALYFVGNIKQCGGQVGGRGVIRGRGRMRGRARGGRGRGWGF